MGLLRVVLLVLGGCSYSPERLDVPGVIDAPGVDPTADAAPDAPASMLDAPNTPEFCDASDPTLVACYRFENTGNDSSQYGNDANTSSVSFSPGRVGDALETTSGSTVDIDESTSLDVGNLTVELWLRLDTVPGAGRVCILDNEGQYAIFVLAGGAIDWSVVTPSGAIRFTAGNAAGNGQFVHLAMTYDGATLRGYTAGVERGNSATGGTGGIQPFPTLGTTIGYNNGGGDHLVGAFDDMRIWNVARSAGQITAAAGL